MSKTHLLKALSLAGLIVLGTPFAADGRNEEPPLCDGPYRETVRVNDDYDSALAKSINKALGKIERRQKKFCENIETSRTKKYFNCSDRKIQEIQNRQYRAYNMISDWLEEITTYEQHHFKNKKELAWATSMLKCIASKISKVKFKCNSKVNQCLQRSSIAYTLPIVNTKIHLCSRWFRLREYGQVGTVLHEVAHKCGATDMAYFGGYIRPQSVGLFHWSKIASTYDYWAIVGFCIPGIDC